jgi:beta-N-acetylhexosaminidase
MSHKETFIKEKIDAMTLDQKVGACLTLGFNGTVLTPNIYEYVTTYHCGGLRLTPQDRKFGNYVNPKTGKTIVSIKGNAYYYKNGVLPPELTGEQYKSILDELSALARERPLGLPLHFSFDNEGEGNNSFSGFSMFPQPMGLCATGDPTCAYEAAKIIGRQARSVGMTFIHSPVLDVNCDHRNPEINIRAYSDKAERVAEFAAATCRGFKEAGVAATGKHFPGRGDSAVDAHYEVPVLDIDMDTLWNRELLPYRHLIEQDLLPSIMLAHTIYSAIDPNEIATVSKKVVTDLLRDRMGFTGVITTDSMTMGGIASRYGVPEACAMSLAAGSDLILMKAQNDLVGQTFSCIKSFVEEGKIPEEELDRKVARILGMKQDMGLFDFDAKQESPSELVCDIQIKKTEQEIAEKCCMVLREEPGVLPLATDKPFLLVEQVATERHNLNQHPGMMFKEALRRNRDLAFCEVGFSIDEEDQERIHELIPGFDTVVVTNFHDRAAAGNTPFLNDLIAKFPYKTFILVTNKPFDLAIPENAANVICSYSKAPQSIRAVVRVLLGETESSGVLPIEAENPALQEA